jgi:hypothetical protein
MIFSNSFMPFARPSWKKQKCPYINKKLSHESACYHRT